MPKILDPRIKFFTLNTLFRRFAKFSNAAPGLFRFEAKNYPDFKRPGPGFIFKSRPSGTLLFPKIFEIGQLILSAIFDVSIVFVDVFAARSAPPAGGPFETSRAPPGLTFVKTDF
jgi:hypothetical protein